MRLRAGISARSTVLEQQRCWSVNTSPRRAMIYGMLHIMGQHSGKRDTLHRVVGWFGAGISTLLFNGCGPEVKLPEAEPPDRSAECHDLVVRQCDSIEIPADVLSACQDLLAQHIARNERCMAPHFYRTEAEKKVFVETCSRIATAPGVTLTALDIQACAEQFEGLECHLGLYPSCVGYGGDLLYPGHDKKGTFELGDVCFANIQCASGYCDQTIPDLCGECKRGRAENESCGEKTDVCIGSLGCVDGKCEPPGARLGESCWGKGVNCQPAWYCKWNGSSDSVCAVREKEGASCHSSNDCEFGTSCQGEICTKLLPSGANCSDDSMCSTWWCNGGVCETNTKTLPTDQGEGEQCSQGYCRDDLVCNKSRVCAVQTLLSEGSACSRSDDPEVACDTGLYCDEDCSNGSCNGACRSWPQPGSPCARYFGCARGARCTDFDPTDVSKSLCIKLGEPGEPCPCLDGLACVSGQCVVYGSCK